jgi:uncharacterized Fe-S center protein
MNVYVTPKDNKIVLKISIGEKSDITKVMKVLPSTLVRDVCAQVSRVGANRAVVDCCVLLRRTAGRHSRAGW